MAVISVLLLRRSGHVLLNAVSKKEAAASPAGHDYRQPKLEEGADAFWQVRKKIEMPEYRCRLFGAALLWPSGYLGSASPVRVWSFGPPPSSNLPFDPREFTES